MGSNDVIMSALTGELQLARGRVASVEPDGQVHVRIESGPGHVIACEVLRTGSGPGPRLSPGQEVLVACPAEPRIVAVILGVIGPPVTAAAAGPEASAGASAAPGSTTPAPGEPLQIAHREIVIEAGEAITLSCGQASIRITHDGRIVLRGEHILSRAKGTQRIKGGSVAIN